MLPNMHIEYTFKCQRSFFEKFISFYTIYNYFGVHGKEPDV